MIEILDAKGKVLNSYNSETPARAAAVVTRCGMPGAGTAGRSRS